MFQLQAVCLHEEPPEGEVTDAQHKSNWGPLEAAAITASQERPAAY